MRGTYQSFRGKRKPLSKKEKAKRKRQREVNKIYEEWAKSKHIYPYKNLHEPPYNPSQAKDLGLDVYWGICKYGHIGERSVKGYNCLACQSITRSIRDARKRGAIKMKLNRDEKKRIAAIYQEAKFLTRTTGLEHHVDHIRPIAAGGLHHPDNLNVITASENLAKGSTYKGKRRNYSRAEKLEHRELFKQKQMQKLKLKSQNSFLVIKSWYLWAIMALIAFYLLDFL